MTKKHKVPWWLALGIGSSVTVMTSLWAACSARKDDTPPPPVAASAPQPTPQPSKIAKDDSAAGPSSPVAESVGQLVVAVADDWSSAELTLRAFERGPDGGWRELGTSWPGAAAEGGLAWGVGEHGDGPPPGRDSKAPRMADGARHSPAGVFRLGKGLGTQAKGPPGSKMVYTKLAAGARCITDVKSDAYNRVVAGDGEAASGIELAGADGRFDLATLVLHNPAALPGRGACTFLHARGTGAVAGVAMERLRLGLLMGWLDPRARPLLVQLPRAEYQALQKAWGLPAL